MRVWIFALMYVSDISVLAVLKAELLQLNHTQFSSLGIFVSKKVGNRKKEDHFYYISFLKLYTSVTSNSLNEMY